MRRPTLWMMAIRCVVLLVLLLLAGGCGGSSGRARPSLSDAMEEAKKPPDEQEPVRPMKKKGEREDVWPVEPHTTIATDESELAAGDTDVAAGAETVTADSAETGREGRFRAGAFAGGGVLSGDPWDGYSSLGLFVGGRIDRASVDARGTVLLPRADEASVQSSSTKKEFGLSIEALGIYHFTPRHTFMDVGVAGTVRFGFFDWTYENPITVDYGNGDEETYESDAIGFLTLLGGIHFTPARSRNLSIGVSLLGGGQVYTRNTLHGFRNDVFDASGVLELTVDLVYSTLDVDPAVID